MSGQIIGATVGNVLEVDANTLAMHAQVRAEDATGIYSVAGASGIMAAGLGSFVPIYSFRWGDASGACALIKRITFSMGTDTVGFAAGTVCSFDLFVARGWTTNDTGGTALTPTGNSNKLRASMATTLASDIRISSTATLTAGARVKDVTCLATIVAGSGSAAGAAIFPPAPIFEAQPGEFPLILERNEGFVIQAKVPATGTWKFGVKVDWSEISNIQFQSFIPF